MPAAKAFNLVRPTTEGSIIRPNTPNNRFDRDETVNAPNGLQISPIWLR